MKIYHFLLPAMVLANLCFNANAQHVSDNTKIKVSAGEIESDAREIIARNMLVYQRSVGGWPKHINNVKIDYNKNYTVDQEASIKEDSFRNDATIDNGATVKEIRFLAEEYSITNKKEYLTAAEKGISYLLKAQYPNGGWPQFFPDTSGYRKHITYNDNAMINVLSLLQDVSNGDHFMAAVNNKLKEKSAKALAKGIECILNTQVMVKGKLTAWCAQHDKNTLKPAKARSYELQSLSGSESVGIIQFLMLQKKPTERLKAAVVAGVAWLNAVKIKHDKIISIIQEPTPTTGGSVNHQKMEEVIWARFYELETNEPFFSGRDGIKKKSLGDIEYERRVGYAWFGSWAKNLIEVKYPAWAAMYL